MSETEPAKEAVLLVDVSRTYPPHADADEVVALKNVNLRIPKGARVAIRGESGSGKSTLLNLIGGMDLPSSGQVRVDGNDLTEMSSTQLAKFRAHVVGFVFQDYQLLPDLTVEENVVLAMDAGDQFSKEEKPERARELLKAVGLKHRRRHLPGRLSGGEKQRVAIARALANGPAIILADEPTGNLSGKSRDQTIDLLKSVSGRFGATLIVVTHDPNVANACDTVYRIRRGSLSQGATPKMDEASAEA
jgi:putative ABC transport system ATP-binding protein